MTLLDLGHGGLDTSPSIVTATSAVTALRGDLIIADSTAGTFAVTLPEAAIVGTVRVVVTAGVGVTVVRSGSDTVDGATSISVAPGTGVELVSNGSTAWRTATRSAGVGGQAIERVNTVAASGAAQTIPEPGLYGLNDITLTAATVTLTFPAASAGKTLKMVIRQDGTGNRAVAWPAGSIFPGGTDVVITTAASSIDYVEALCVAEDVWMITRIGAAYAT
ncbi:MAG: hypothetical protein ACM362_10630 [Candidatus Methylomirabilota bacterium]